LASASNISFIKRGAYAWEPLLNNMSSERSTITIDGMHVFGACTDKMDPITSYVESNNLAAIDIKSGQEGNLHGATVAGSIDLKRRNTAFGLQKKIGGAYQTGFEFNNKQTFNLGNYITQVTNLWQMEVLPFGRLEIIMMEMTMKYGIRNIINSMRRWVWPIKQVRFLLLGRCYF
jgi:iron complex outermembrane receptor protein